MAQGFTQPLTITGTAVSGDLSGTLPSPTVAKINGVALGTTTATSGRFLVADGSAWQSVAMSGDATLASSGAITLDTVEVTKGGTGLTTSTQGDILYSDASNSWAKLAKNASATRYLSNTGTSNNPAWAQINLANGVTGTLPVANGGTGVTSSNPIIQRVSTETGALSTGTTTIPFDDTIPQNTEGNQVMTLAITPVSSSNILVIDVVVIGCNSQAGLQANTTALFQDTTANALAATFQNSSAAHAATSTFLRHIMSAGTTSSTTFKVRWGGSAAGTASFNGQAGARLFGGVFSSSITITEYST